MLKATYENKADIPAGYEDLYKEFKGKYEVQIEGVIAQSALEDTKKALSLQREDVKKLKEELRQFNALGSVEEIKSIFEEKEELLNKVATGGASSEDAKKLLEERKQALEARYKREMEVLKKDLDGAKQESESLKKQLVQTKLHDEVRKAALKKEVIPTAIEDVLMWGERDLELQDDGTFKTKGLDSVDDWVSSLRNARPHYFPSSQTGSGSYATNGAGIPTGTQNVFHKDHPMRETAINKFIKEHGQPKAKLHAQAVNAPEASIL